MFTVFGFYKFKKSNFLKKNKEFLQRKIFKNNISGTIILSQEGINGTIAGKRRNISQIIKSLKKVFNFKDFDSKNMSQSHFQPFHKGKIKIKNEVVPLGLKINSNNKKLNRYISGKSWNKLISNTMLENCCWAALNWRPNLGACRESRRISASTHCPMILLILSRFWKRPSGAFRNWAMRESTFSSTARRALPQTTVICWDRPQSLITFLWPAALTR